MPKPLSESRVFVITGAGISAESGIPTFRGAGDYWRNLDPTKLATEEAFRADPELVWAWYHERREAIRPAQPNVAHAAVVQLAAQAREFLLLTQNVDDLHARAEWNGHRLTPEQMVQIHGDIFVSRCSRCDHAHREAKATAGAPGVPTCPDCGAMLRPGVVWFGEQLSVREIERVEAFLGRGACDLTLVIGTTAVFGYIVQWALDAKGPAGRLVEINPEATAASRYATEQLREPAAVALPRFVAEFAR